MLRLRHGHHLAEELGRRVDRGHGVQGLPLGEAPFLDCEIRREEALEDRQIDALGMLYPPLVRKRVADKGQTESIPLEDEAGGLLEVDGRNRSDRDSVLLKDDVVDLRPVVLVHLEREGPRVDRPRQRPGHPGPGLLHVVHGRLRAPLRGRAASARSPDTQRYRAVVLRAVDVERLEVTRVVHVKMREEDLVEEVQRYPERVDPLQRAGPHVEDELVTVAQLDQEAGCRLLEPRHRHAGATGDNAHLVGIQCLGAREVHVVARARTGSRPLAAGSRGLRTRVLETDIDVQCDGTRNADHHGHDDGAKRIPRINHSVCSFEWVADSCSTVATTGLRARSTVGS